MSFWIFHFCSYSVDVGRVCRTVAVHHCCRIHINFFRLIFGNNYEYLYFLNMIVCMSAFDRKRAENKSKKKEDKHKDLSIFSFSFFFHELQIFFIIFFFFRKSTNWSGYLQCAGYVQAKRVLIFGERNMKKFKFKMERKSCQIFDAAKNCVDFWHEIKQKPNRTCLFILIVTVPSTVYFFFNKLLWDFIDWLQKNFWFLFVVERAFMSLHIFDSLGNNIKFIKLFNLIALT